MSSSPLDQLEQVFVAVGNVLMPGLHAIGDVLSQVAPDYWGFLNRPPPIAPGRGIEGIPHLWRDSALLFLGFSFAFVTLPSLLSRLFPKWYASLDEKKKREIPSYVVCMIHHFYVVPRSWYHIYLDLQLQGEAALLVDYAPLEAVVSPVCIGYLAADTLFYALPNLSVEYMVHHTLTLFLVWKGINAPSYIVRFIPHLLICDTTQIFFNTAWLLRLAGWRAPDKDDTKEEGQEGKESAKDKSQVAAVDPSLSWKIQIVTFLEMSFAVFFLLLRVINMPLTFLVITLNGKAVSMEWARFVYLPLTLLQTFWFSKIAKAVIFGRSKGGKGKGKSKTVTAAAAGEGLAQNAGNGDKIVESKKHI